VAHVPEPTPYSTELEAIAAILSVLGPLDETQRKFVLRTVADRLAIPESDTSLASRDQPEDTLPRAKHGATRAGTPKAFLAAKRPSSEVERIACLAYFLTHMRNTRHFKTKDIVSLNTEAAAPRLAVARRTIDNAMRRNQFLAPAGSGSKQISALGEQVVGALPDREAVTALTKASPNPRRMKAAKKRSLAKQ
jgi:hypothetical protein